MMMSTKGRYGLRVMMELALRFGRGPVLVGELAQAQELPPKYLHVLLGSLRASGLVRTLRGPSGGYELAREPAKITALEVVEAMEGKIQLAGCEDNSRICSKNGSCAAQELWCAASKAMSDILAGASLASLAERQMALRHTADSWSI